MEIRTVFHLWFHPSCDAENLEYVFPRTLEYISKLKDEVCVTTMAGLVEQISSTGA